MARPDLVPRLLFALLALSAWAGAAAAQDSYAEERRRMVEEQLVARGIDDQRVLDAMADVPRHLFVPEDQRERAYSDQPLPIGFGQTIYQPYVVAQMTALLGLGPNDKVLEIGTGSGYNTAVLSRVAGRVYTIEIIEPLGRKAMLVLFIVGQPRERRRRRIRVATAGTDFRETRRSILTGGASIDQSPCG